MHFIHTDTCHTASIHTHIHILHLANFSVIYLILLIHTDTNRYSQNTYRYMSYCAHTYSYAHFTLSQFSSSACRRPGAWQELTGSDGRADSDNRAVTASAVAASRAGEFTTWKSWRRAKRRRAGSNRFAQGNRQCNHKSTKSM